MLVSSRCVRRLVGIERTIRSFGGIGDPSDTWIERAFAITPRHLGHWDDLDLRGVARGAELLEALPAEGAQRVHRRFEEFARIKFASVWRCDLAECRLIASRQSVSILTL